MKVAVAFDRPVSSFWVISDVQLPDSGSNSSALAVATPCVVPPVTSTRPLGSMVAVCCSRSIDMVLAGALQNVPLYSSVPAMSPALGGAAPPHAGSTGELGQVPSPGLHDEQPGLAKPPITNTRRSGKSTAAWKIRVESMFGPGWTVPLTISRSVLASGVPAGSWPPATIISSEPSQVVVWPRRAVARLTVAPQVRVARSNRSTRPVIPVDVSPPTIAAITSEEEVL